MSPLPHRSIGLMATVGLLMLVAVMVRLGPTPHPPAFAGLRTKCRPSDVEVRARAGEPLARLRVDLKSRRLGWTALTGLREDFVKTVVQIEDRRFLGHPGIDWLAAIGLGRDLIHKRRLRGGSTITMQTARLLPMSGASCDEALAASSHRRGSLGARLVAKFREARQALALERHWRKADVLEAYLNLVPLRGEIIGVTAAARELMGKAPTELDALDGLIFAAMLSSPNQPLPQLAHRACRLAPAVGLIDHCLAIRRRVFDLGVRGTGLDLAHHAARRALMATPPPKHRTLTTTLDFDLQRLAARELAAQLRELAGQNVRDGAVMVVANRTGEVLAYVGSNARTSRAAAVDGVMAHRQAGSTLKPFLYALAFEQRLLTPATLIDDAPVDLAVAGGIFQPRNYDSTFHGPVSVRTALGSSLNVPAVRAIDLVGIDRFASTLRELGIGVPMESDSYGPSLALGSLDVTLWDLVGAYRALANGGEWTPLQLLAHPPSHGSDGADGQVRHQVLDPGAAFITGDILADRGARTLAFGPLGPLDTPYFAAVKTGTSKDMRDNWCVGFTRDFTIGVWVGNFDGAPMWNVSGVSGAAPLWRTLADHLQAQRPSQPPTPPAGVSQVAVHQGIEARLEWLLADSPLSDLGVWTATPVANSMLPARLTYPVDGEVIAIDPDLPRARQQLVPEVQGASGATSLDGRPFTGALALTELTSGRHELTVTDSDGRLLDRARFVIKR